MYPNPEPLCFGVVVVVIVYEVEMSFLVMKSTHPKNVVATQPDTQRMLLPSDSSTDHLFHLRVSDVLEVCTAIIVRLKQDRVDLVLDVFPVAGSCVSVL